MPTSLKEKTKKQTNARNSAVEQVFYKIKMNTVIDNNDDTFYSLHPRQLAYF